MMMFWGGLDSGWSSFLVAREDLTRELVEEVAEVVRGKSRNRKVEESWSKVKSTFHGFVDRDAVAASNREERSWNKNSP